MELTSGFASEYPQLASPIVQVLEYYDPETALIVISELYERSGGRNALRLVTLNDEGWQTSPITTEGFAVLRAGQYLYIATTEPFDGNLKAYVPYGLTVLDPIEVSDHPDTRST